MLTKLNWCSAAMVYHMLLVQWCFRMHQQVCSVVWLLDL